MTGCMIDRAESKITRFIRDEPLLYAENLWFKTHQLSNL